MSFERSEILLSPKAVLHKPGEQGFIPMTETPLDFDIETPYAVVYDGGSDRILYRKGGDRVIYPASTTKLLTILTALQVLTPLEIIRPGDELSLLDEDSSVAGVEEGHALTVEMLIEAMLLPSGNDAAYVLAAAAGERISEGMVSGADAVPVFIAFMEEYGRSIGLVGTHFTVPDGLAFEEHYTTLEDMVLIGKAAMKCPLIRRYAATAHDNVTYQSGHTNTWTNTNPLLRPDTPWYRPAVTGLKTGYLRHNSCILLSVEANNSYYLVGLFGAEDSDMRCADAVRIVDKLTGGEVTL
jgi:D-alanyl-D-alanine carboxypeptidase (penicillin-binding protein 5/6)